MMIGGNAPFNAFAEPADRAPVVFFQDGTIYSLMSEGLTVHCGGTSDFQQRCHPAVVFVISHENEVISKIVHKCEFSHA